MKGFGKKYYLTVSIQIVYSDRNNESVLTVSRSTKTIKPWYLCLRREWTFIFKLFRMYLSMGGTVDTKMVRQLQPLVIICTPKEINIVTDNFSLWIKISSLTIITDLLLRTKWFNDLYRPFRKIISIKSSIMLISSQIPAFFASFVHFSFNYR